MMLSPALDTAPRAAQATASRTGARPAVARAAPQVSPMLPVAAVLVAAAVFAAINLFRYDGAVAALWGASGLAVAFWLRSGSGRLYDLAFAALTAVSVAGANSLSGNTAAMTAMFTVANMVEIGLAVVLVRRFAPSLRFDSVSVAARFLFIACALAPLPSGLLVAGGLASMNGADPVEVLRTWWLAHALGFAVVAPFCLSVSQASLSGFRAKLQLLEGVGLLLAVTLLAATIFLWSRLPFSFLILPALLLIAARLRVLGVAAAILIVAVIVVGGTIHGMALARIPTASLADRVMVSQMFVLFGCVPVLFVAALLEERDRLAARARAGQARAERASQGKSRLLANVAHEIKSPVGGVIGIGELWASGALGPATPQQVEMAEMLVKTARQIETLAHDLLDVARAEAGAVQVELRPVDVNGVVDDVRRALALRPDAGWVRVEVEPSEDAVALADSVRLTQVVGNLATNALKYGGSGGVVTFRVLRRAEVIRIEVADRGPGLSAERQAQLFEPFNRLGLERSAIEGHGIGLALAKRLIELQGGSIGVDSVEGEGATFWIDLPAA